MSFGKRGVMSPEPSAAPMLRRPAAMATVPPHLEPEFEAYSSDNHDGIKSVGGALKKVAIGFGAVAAAGAALYALGLYSPIAAVAAAVILFLLLVIGAPILVWFVMLWLCRWAGRFLAGGDRALASMIGTGLFVTCIVGSMLTSCMLQQQIANSLSKAIAGAAVKSQHDIAESMKDGQRELEKQMQRQIDEQADDYDRQLRRLQQ
jgi:hypothetical protein